MAALAVLLLIGMSQNGFDLDSLEALMASDPVAAAKAIRSRFKPEDLKSGILPYAEGTKVLFAKEMGDSKEALRIVKNQGMSAVETVLELKPLHDGLVAGIKTFADGEAFRCQYFTSGPVRQTMELEVYKRASFVEPMPGGMRGELRDMGELKSTTFPGTTRRWYVYLPPHLDRTKHYPVLIATDAQWDRQWIANGLDSAASEGLMNLTVGIFVEPGQTSPGTYSNRSKEYDTLSGDYAKFLLGEVLPQVEKIVPLSKNPENRALVGMSSGGICAFTACWERPEEFGVAISFVGSFTNIASGGSKRDGGHNYPFLIRKTDKKPIRVFLQDGVNDLNNDHGSWWLGNLQMESALRYKGYDVSWVAGKGFHNTKHARSIFERVLLWWKPTTD